LAQRGTRATIHPLKKRTLALAFLGFVLALVAATLGVLRTRWAGERKTRTGLPCKEEISV